MELLGGGEYRDNFDIHKVIDKYQSEFGKGCIKILLYEDLRENPDRFYAGLSDVLEVNKNELFGLMSKGGFYRQRALTDSGLRRKKLGLLSIYILVFELRKLDMSGRFAEVLRDY